jgi:hypothetical protein
MTQPEVAVGGPNDAPVIAAEPTLEDRFAIFSGDDDEEVRENNGSTEPDLPELSAEDLGEVEDPAPEESRVTPPASWKAEEKAEFARLPRALQETLTRREAERERFVQGKAQEAARARCEIERDAITAIQQLQQEAAARFQHFEQQLAVSEPDPQLIVEDPELYAAQLADHRHYAAQRQQAQQLAAMAAQRANMAQQQIAAIEAQQTQAVLEQHFPEYLSAEHGTRLRNELGSVALALGYAPEQLADVDGRDILAMRMAADWKAKAEKYDRLVATKMDSARVAKDLPRVSRPGVATGAGAVANQRYANDRQKMKSGDKDAGVRVFSRFL